MLNDRIISPFVEVIILLFSNERSTAKKLISFVLRPFVPKVGVNLIWSISIFESPFNKCPFATTRISYFPPFGLSGSLGEQGLLAQSQTSTECSITHF